MNNTEFKQMSWQERVKFAAKAEMTADVLNLCLEDCADVIVSVLLRGEVQFSTEQQHYCLNHYDPWVRVAALKREDFLIPQHYLEQSKQSQYKIEQFAAIEKQRSQQ